MEAITPKPLELFCGTGGVGKTTLATSRALYLNELGKKVLLITIDPAKRLKEVLGLDESLAGQVETLHTVQGHELAQPLDTLLMSPTQTLKRMAKRHDVEENFNNRILKVLSRPYGGMNEILSMVELQIRHQEGKYDHIILDTPPGSHFLDFLESTKKFQQFFDKKFIEVFKFINKKSGGTGEKTKLMTRFISTGLKKLLGYFEKVTGAEFMEEFVDAVSTIYQTKDSFLEALSFQQALEKVENSNWVLVTSSEHGKLQEAKAIKESAQSLIHNDSYVAINKCQGKYLDAWDIDPQTPHFNFLSDLKKSMVVREENLKSEAKNIFPKILLFPEVLSANPLEHVVELKQSWKND